MLSAAEPTVRPYNVRLVVDGINGRIEHAALQYGGFESVIGG